MQVLALYRNQSIDLLCEGNTGIYWVKLLVAKDFDETFTSNAFTFYKAFTLRFSILLTLNIFHTLF